jgi:hypothetical protein
MSLDARSVGAPQVLDDGVGAHGDRRVSPGDRGVVDDHVAFERPADDVALAGHHRDREAAARCTHQQRLTAAPSRRAGFRLAGGSPRAFLDIGEGELHQRARRRTCRRTRENTEELKKRCCGRNVRPGGPGREITPPMKASVTGKPRPRDELCPIAQPSRFSHSSPGCGPSPRKAASS